MRESKGTAEWNGTLKEGKGILSTGSGAITDSPYSFGTRFGQDLGTNPEELVAAAHAACFSMALSAQLSNADMTPESVKTTATVTLEKVGDGFGVTKSHLDVVATIPGADQAKFQELAESAKKGCPISKLLNAEITMSARLEA